MTDGFARWYSTLSERQADALDARVELLQEHGPNLGRPVVDRIEGSRIHHLKELRVRSDGALRILFVFDPGRTAVLLLGGDKSGHWSSWYATAIPRAEAMYDDYLEGLSR